MTRKKLVAVLAAAVFPLLATTAHADVMAAGTYSGHITGGTLTLGNGKFHDLAVPAGEAFSFTIPAGASAPVAWTAPATHVELPLQTDVDSSGIVRTAGGSLDISSIAGTVDPATGAAHGAASAHGVLRLTNSPPDFSQFCYIGGLPSAPSAPQPLLPVDLDLNGTGSISDTAFTANLDCGSLIPLGMTGLPNIGDTVMPSSLTLGVTFTRQPDPQPTIKVVTQTITTTAPAAQVRRAEPQGPQAHQGSRGPQEGQLHGRQGHAQEVRAQGHRRAQAEQEGRRRPCARQQDHADDRALTRGDYFSTRPWRSACAAASPRVRTPSLARIDATWCSTVLRDRNSRSAMSRLRRPSATSARTSSSRAVRWAGFSRVASRGPRGRPLGAAPAQLAGDDRGRATGAERQQLLVAAPLRRFVTRAGARERRLVRAAERGPALGGLLVLAGQLERVRLGDRDRGRDRRPGTARQLASSPTTQSASRLSASSSTRSVSVTTRA